MAQQIISTTIESVVLGDIYGITVRRTELGDVEVHVNYGMRDSTGGIHEEKESLVQLSAQARSTLKSYVENTIIPQLNLDLGFS